MSVLATVEFKEDGVSFVVLLKTIPRVGESFSFMVATNKKVSHNYFDLKGSYIVSDVNHALELDERNCIAHFVIITLAKLK